MLYLFTALQSTVYRFVFVYFRTVLTNGQGKFIAERDLYTRNFTVFLQHEIVANKIIP